MNGLRMWVKILNMNKVVRINEFDKQKLMFKYLIYISFFILLTVNIFSQEEECVFTLREAEKLYQQGLIEEIPELITGCIEDGFSKEDRLQAYKLLILTYLFEDEVQKAEEAMFSFIKKYPEYEIVPTDPVDFVYLYESYQALPILSIGICVGGSYSNTTIIEPYGTHNLNSPHGDYNQCGMGLQLGLRLTFNIYENTDVNLELLYSQNKFEYVNENLFNVMNQSFDETQTRFDIPLTFTYDIDIKKPFWPFVRAGCNFGILLDANALSYIKYNDFSHEDKTGPDMKITAQRKTLNYWGIIGTGIKYKVTRGYFIADVNYNFGLSNQVNPKKRTTIDNLEQAFYYFHTDDDFRLNSLNFRLGYVYTFYKPTKKK